AHALFVDAGRADRRELGAIHLVAAQYGERRLPGESHLGGVEERPIDLLLERVRPAVPELLRVETRVEHGRRVAASLGAADSRRDGMPVRTAEIQAVARSAGDRAVL